MANPLSDLWHRLLARVSRRERTELRVLLGALAVLALAIAFVYVADNVIQGDTRDFDERVLRSLRNPRDPAAPIGPRWLRACTGRVPSCSWRAAAAGCSTGR